LNEVELIQKGRVKPISLKQLLDNYKVEATPNFLAELKGFQKISFTKNDIASLAAQLAIEPTMGTSLGMNAYKIRMTIRSKGKGKSAEPG